MNDINIGIDSDTYWMTQAIGLAQKALSKNEVPVGAIVVLNNQIIGQGYNCPISTHDPTAHAEIIALREAAQYLRNYRIINTTVYVTLEPCLMCLGALMHARISRLVFGANDDKLGAVRHANYSKNFNYTNHIMTNECAAILKQFFQERR